MSDKFRGNLLLLLTAAIWGSAFVAQSVGMDYIEPFTFNGIRQIIAAVVLVPVAYIFVNRDRRIAQSGEGYTEPTAEEKKQSVRTHIIGGFWCGVCLFVASSLQQIGIQYTTAGKAGFVTALYILIVPILGIFLKKRVRPILWFCVIIAAVGLYLLCMQGGFGLEKGDFYVFLCAIVFSLHILVIDHYSPKTNGVALSCIQFAFAGLFAIPPILLFENPEMTYIIMAWKPILYAGILSGAGGYTLQILGQKNTDPTVASLLLSLESVFAVISGMIILHEMMSGRELLGCALMFAAIILAQLPERKKL